MSYIAGYAALIRMRYKEPNMERPFKAPWFPMLPYFLILISVLFLVGAVYSDMNSSKYALIFLAISYPLFRWVEKINEKN